MSLGLGLGLGKDNTLMQSVAKRLGINPADVLFYLSNRNLTRQNKRAVSVRRASDSKTSVVPFRPPVAYDAPRNMLHYDPTTWAEWTLTGASIVGGKVTVDNNAGTASPTAQLVIKPSTKYGFLFNVSQNTRSITGYPYASSAARLFPSDIPITAGFTGNIKSVQTSKASWSDSGFVGYFPAGTGIVSYSDIRIFELPAGSQIEADFTNLTADALAAKYPMVGANGAAIGAAPGVAKDRVCNAFANGDGRYGKIGWFGWSGNAVSAIAGGVRSVGDGTATFVRAYSPAVTISATRKYFIKAYVYRPVGISSNDFRITTYNTLSVQSIALGSVIADGESKWVNGIITQTNVGTTPVADLYVHAQFADNATQSGKVLDVKYWSIISMGDSAADPHYNDTAEQFDAYLRTQPGVVLTPDGEYYVPPYGLCPGEQDLDITAAFGGTSQLYDTTAYGQEANTNDATQSTAASQPKIWDNGLSYPGLGLFDGSDDYMVADLPDITTGPATWWARVNKTGNAGYVFARNLSAYEDIQYAMQAPVAENMAMYFNGGAGSVTIPVANNTDALVVFVWDGSTITPYKKINGVVTAGTPFAFTGPLTSRAKRFIGCRSASADGSTRSSHLKGIPYEIGITKTALTPAQISKL